MKKFNPEKELNKIKKGNKNKLVIGVITLLLIIAVGSTYALYQIRHTQKLVFNTVGEFKKRDIILSVLVDGETKSEFPGKDDGYVFDNIQCDKPGIEASFNNETWKLTLTTGTTNKCTVKFITKPYMDDSGANYPDLFQGLIPIRYDQGKIYIADYKQKWYDYTNHEWANAVLIDHNNPEVMKKFYTDGKLNVNTEITTDDILQMYVWIPRYKYQLFNAVNGQSSNPQMINIEFENTIETTGEVSCNVASNGKETCTNDENGNWYTHPAFTFGDTQLRGIWIGKFEPSDPTDPNGRANNVIKEITILPNKTSMVNKKVQIMFDAIRDIELQNAQKYNLNSNEIDTHMMKNMDWGAVAYLTSSKYGKYESDGSCGVDGCEVWINNTAQGTDFSGTYARGGTATGCVGNTLNGEIKWNSDGTKPATCDLDKQWNQNGVKASTTGNMYGIYDMAGGAWDSVMGVIAEENGENPNWYLSGFSEKPPASKYYNLYENITNATDHAKGHLGDATRETLINFGRNLNGWYSDYSALPIKNASKDIPWVIRGAGTDRFQWEGGSSLGVFAFGNTHGALSDNFSFRSVLTAQDGTN